MSSLKSPQKFVSFALLLGLSACSDATQFTERSLPYTLDAIAEEESPQGMERGESSLDPAETSSSEGEEIEPLIVYEGQIDPLEGEEKLAGGAPSGGSEPEDSSQSQQNQTSGGSGNKQKTADSSGSGSTGNETGGSGSTGNETGGSGSTGSIGTSSVPMLFSECVNNPQKAIIAQVYPLPEDTQKLPDFSNLMPIGDDVCITQLNITERQFTEGFPGVPELFEWFGLDMYFNVNVPSSGTYTFTLKSDDGAQLFIDGQKVVDNDGLHATKEVSANKYLSKGMHSFHIKYYQGPRYHIALELFWKVPGANNRSYIPESYLSRP